MDEALDTVLKELWFNIEKDLIELLKEDKKGFVKKRLKELIKD